MRNYTYDHAWRRARERISLGEAEFDPETTRHLEARGVGAGWCCLEVGGGGGSIAAWLARRVRPSGRVLATDIDTRFLEALDLPNLEVRCHDIAAAELPQGEFDLVHARGVLHHLPGCEQALDRMVAALKPGGWIVIEEPDWVSFHPDPALDSATVALAEKVWSAHDQLMRARRVDAYYGRRLYGQFRRRGLAEVEAAGKASVISRSRNALTSPNKRGLQRSLDRFSRDSRLGFPSESGYEAQAAKCSNWQIS